MNKAPAFQLYAADFLTSLTGLPPDAVGVLIKLLCVMWSQSKDQSSIIDDDTFIARALGISIDEWKKIRAELQHPERPQFEEGTGRLVSTHLRQQAEKQSAFREQQRQNSLKGVAARSALRQPTDQPAVNPSVDPAVGRSVDPSVTQRTTFPIPIPSPIRTSIPTSKKKTIAQSERSPKRSSSQEQLDMPPAVDHEFEEFWKNYPMRNGKRLGRPEAVQKWNRLKAEDRKQVLIAVGHYASSKQVTEGIGIKDPHRWLKKGQDDEPWREWIEPEQQGALNGHAVGIDQKNFHEGAF